jgi:CRP/FNR family transcriptional regulator, cyclic AMP receptor protein
MMAQPYASQEIRQPDPSPARGRMPLAEASDIRTRSEAPPVTNPLALVDIFQALPQKMLDELHGQIRRRSFQKGAIIFHRDDPGSILYLLTRGRVRITITSSLGSELTLAILHAGDCFGEMALLHGGERTATAVALEATETLTLRSEDFMALLQDYPDAALTLLRMLAQRLTATNELLLASCYLDVPGRLARKLLELTASDGVATDDGIRIELALTQQALATLLGASRESTGRALNEFRERGLLRLENQRIVILRRDDLERFL